MTVKRTITSIEEALSTNLSVLSSLPESDIQRLWFASLRRDWSSLVLVPAHPEGSCQDIAEALVRVGSAHRGKPLKLLSGRGIALGSASNIILEMNKLMQAGEMVVIALDSVVANPTGIAIALAADATILCVEMGQSDLESSKQTVAMLGSDRFIGAVAIERR